MEVILLERVGRLGGMGDTVKVRPGFARNFLIPQKKALRATEENKAAFEKRREQLAAENAKSKAEAEKIAAKLNGYVVNLQRQASEDGKLYGSVVVRDIADELAAQGFKVERRQVQLNAAIKSTGSYKVGVQLHPEVTVGITVNVSRNEAEAIDLNAPADLLDEDAEVPQAAATEDVAE